MVITVDRERGTIRGLHETRKGGELPLMTIALGKWLLPSLGLLDGGPCPSTGLGGWLPFPWPLGRQTPSPNVSNQNFWKSSEWERQ